MKAGLPGRVLVFCTHGIGDVVMCVPMLRGLRAMLPAASITVLLRGRTQAQVLEGRGLDLNYAFLSDMRGSPRALLRTIRQWRRDRADVAIATFNVAPRRAKWLARAAGARRTIGFDRFDAGGCFDLSLAPSGRHKIDENLRLLDALAARRSSADASATPDWPILPDEHRQARELFAQHGLGGRPIIAVTPGCTAHEHFKRWPARSYEEALGQAGRDRAFDVVVFGSAEEASLAPRGEHVVNLAGGLTLRQAAAGLAQCDGVLGGDCGLTHIASALGVPTLVLMGPTQPAITAPRGPRTRIIASPHTCVGCYERAMKIDPTCPAPRCMQTIEPADVARQLMTLLDEAASCAG